MSDDTPTERFTPPNDPHGVPSGEPPVDPAADATADLPTTRFEQPGDDAPTTVLPNAAFTPAAAASQTLTTATEPATPPRKKLSGWMIALIVIAAVLLVALVIALIVLFSRGDGTPVASGSPTPTESSATPTESSTPSTPPSPSPTPTPPPSTAPTFTAFSPANNAPVVCADETSSVPLTFTWTSTGASLAWIGVGTTNAKENPFESVPTSGTNSDIAYQCSLANQVYTVTLDDGAGNLTSHSVTLVRQVSQ